MIDQKIDDLLFGPKSNPFLRLNNFRQLVHTIDDYQYWKFLRKVYQASDSTFSAFAELFASKRPLRETLMTTEEQHELEQLSNNSLIYRVMTVRELEGGHYGVSWTLSRQMAEYLIAGHYANVQPTGEPLAVHEMHIDKSKIVCLFDDHGQKEVIVLPSDTAQ
jgi:hypothetical protein